MPIYIFDFATETDFDTCKTWISSILHEEEQKVEKLTYSIMHKAYEIGGGYDYSVIMSILRLYKDNPSIL